MPNVFAKLSGLDAGGSDNWSATDLAPYVEHALCVFGPDRLMFGSNWPVSNLSGGYAKVWRETKTLLERLSPDEKRQVLGGTAVEVYGLQADALNRLNAV
jgi:L-fuconolactonase